MKSSATEQELGLLHAQMAAYFSKRLTDANGAGTPLSAQELKEIREFLKDSHIEASPDEATMLELRYDIPFEVGQWSPK